MTWNGRLVVRKRKPVVQPENEQLPAKEHLYVYVEQETLAALDDYCADYGITRSEAVDRAIMEL
jgi:hypothetical protein